ncbi:MULTISPECIES: TetR/AcrR family transcriptional regulator [Dactylosporangium]|uniref:TetR family transcriptional regulator n=2 Tax=Dactylosporangium TaxID=35753 RepID=A0A9W6KV01_9ACTN|nr:MULTISPECIES: TetR/AcrR family transcriptional regulator [Dactylosporangium]UAB93052.1 TetR family transcriptional regulator [Dactylosporangium vinaceum]UWZ41465.1 TetR family transcriptional regulator [Dactylosporangium matsuzakiense]GLL07026.1 TetR family transcriptional regulator [Dactylosporangium matsuzakiense]
MGRTAGRTPDDTRRALLDAAADAVRARGIHASLDEIARFAGVSKGGLIYHFASKDDLILELARDQLAAFQASIDAALDPADTSPGRLTRAYIRAALTPAGDDAAVRQSIALITQLMTLPAVAELARADAERLDAALAADGLPPDVLALVVAAADGMSCAPLWGAATRTPAHRRLTERLLHLTRHPELWES